MIIVCPQCAKEYRVDPSELPPAKTSAYKNAGKGWWLSCRFCHKEWWYQAPRGFSWYEGSKQNAQFGQTVVRKPSSFVDKTDLSRLQSQPPQQESDSYEQNLRMYQQYTPYSERPEDVMELQTPKPSKGAVQSTAQKRLKRYIIAFTVLLIVGIVATYSIQTNKQYGASFVNATIKLNVPEKQKYVLGLKIYDLNYKINSTLDNNKIHVFGFLQNTNDVFAKTPLLVANVWGQCKPGALAKNMRDANTEFPHCLLKSWQFKVAKQELAPNESIELNTENSIPIDTLISDVDINFLAEH